jgi:hypothetical protein
MSLFDEAFNALRDELADTLVPRPLPRPESAASPDPGRGRVTAEAGGGSDATTSAGQCGRFARAQASDSLVAWLDEPAAEDL